MNSIPLLFFTTDTEEKPSSKSVYKTQYEVKRFSHYLQLIQRYKYTCLCVYAYYYNCHFLRTRAYFNWTDACDSSARVTLKVCAYARAFYRSSVNDWTGVEVVYPFLRSASDPNPSLVWRNPSPVVHDAEKTNPIPLLISVVKERVQKGAIIGINLFFKERIFQENRTVN